MLLRRIILAPFLTAALATAGSLPASAQSRAPLSAVPYWTGQLVNLNSGKCLDVYNWSKSTSATIDQWTCGNNQANQLWRLIENSNGVSFWIQNVNSGMCLEPETNEVGTYIVQNPCNASDPLQSWLVVADGSSTWYENANWPASDPTGLDVYGASKANHAWIDLWYMNWNAHQTWNVPPGF